MGVVLKKVVQEHPKFGLKKFVQKLKEELPDEIYYPSYKTVGRFLKKNNFIKVKHQLKPFISSTNFIVLAGLFRGPRLQEELSGGLL